MRYFLTFIILSVSLASYAETSIKIPVDFISEITNSKEFKSTFNFAEKLLINQIMKNSSLNGIKLKKYNVDTLIEQFNKDNMLQKYGTNKLVEPMTGITFEFNSDGKCKKENCTIVVDLNSVSMQDENNLEDNYSNKMVFTLKRNSKNELEIIFPKTED